MDEALSALLAKSQLFGRLGAETRAAVARVARRRSVSAGELVFREGDVSDGVFLVERGMLEATRCSEQGADVPLRVLEPGDVGGLTSLGPDGGGRSATLRARRDSLLVMVRRQDFLELLARYQELNRALIAHLSAKVQAKNRDLVRLAAAAQTDGRTGVAFFDTKLHDRETFDARVPPDLRLQYFEPRLSPTTAALAHGFRIVCAFVNDDLSEPVIERLASAGVELIALRCAGYNNVDLAAAERLGLSVVRVPAYSPHSVAEHTVALILALNRKVHRAHNRVREGNFSLTGLVGFDLHGRTAGVVGLGKIGQCLARILVGFGMEVLAHDGFVAPAVAAEVGARLVPLEELLQRADVVSLHAPLTEGTHHLINTERIAMMRRGVMLLNTSRGGLVDSRALIQGLKTGHIGAAGLDVYEEEGDYFFEDRSNEVITDDLLARLMTFNNVIITSHQAYLTEEALANIAETTLANIADYLSGQRGSDLRHVVSLPKELPSRPRT